MTGADVQDVAKEALIVLLKMGTPLMLISLVTGLLVSFFQAITQIQEMTLAFIPKILVLFVSLIFLFPYLSGIIEAFAASIFERMMQAGLPTWST